MSTLLPRLLVSPASATKRLVATGSFPVPFLCVTLTLSEMFNSAIEIRAGSLVTKGIPFRINFGVARIVCAERAHELLMSIYAYARNWIYLSMSCEVDFCPRSNYLVYNFLIFSVNDFVVNFMRKKI